MTSYTSTPTKADKSTTLEFNNGCKITKYMRQLKNLI